MHMTDTDMAGAHQAGADVPRKDLPGMDGGGGTTDVLQDLIAAVRDARATGMRVHIRGGGSKARLLGQTGGSTTGSANERSTAGGDVRPSLRRLDLSRHRGVVAYEPSELVFTARAGTSLVEAEALLAEQGQAFPFEPPAFGAGATLGGMVACGWSGPARPWGGAVRDALLGVQMINGMGQCLRFGGQVMKNVAGYDLARLQAGAFGRLGALVEVSIKVLPHPACSRTRILELDRDAALTRVLALQRSAEPVTATVHLDGCLHVRFQGNEAAVTAAAARCGGSEPDAAAASAFWASMREHTHRFYASSHDQAASDDGEVWRLSLPHAAAFPAFEGTWCTEWAGAQRWLRAPTGTTLAAARVFAAAVTAGGHAERWSPVRARPASHGIRGELERRLIEAFDPDGLFAPPSGGDAPAESGGS